MFSVIFWTPILRLAKIEISGTQYLNTAAVEASVSTALSGTSFWVFPKNHRWLFSEENIASRLEEEFFLNDVRMEIRGRKLFVALSEKVSRALWRTGEASYVMDEHGRLVSEHGLEPLPLLPIVDIRAHNVSVGDFALEETQATLMLDLISLLAERGVVATELLYDATQPYFLQVALPDGYKVILDPSQDIAEQVERYFTVLRTDTRDPSTYEYIDVRFGNRVYVKDR
jgi:hypothetical protein